ncbi:MAG TPA: hypothetical protein ENK14_05530 [Caldithrix sp.]|nr:hypothetical protein [Caldithrix sp.]
MAELIFVFVFFAIAALIMMLSLQFSKYKRRSTSCCGGGHCVAVGHDHDEQVHTCHSEKLEFVNNYQKKQ